MRRPAFKLCVAVLAFAFGVYASLTWHAFAPRPSPPASRAGPPPPAAPPAPRCVVHNAALSAERVPVHYGMPVNAPLRREAERALFPHSGRAVNGGCARQGKTHAEVGGRAAEAEWLRRNPNPGDW